MKKILLYFVVCLSIISAQVSIVNAWDGETGGQIQQIDVTEGPNYGFRVTLQGLPPLCSQGTYWAYINDTDSNYKVYVAVLLAAKASNSTVTLYTYNGGAGCRIGYMTLQ